MPQARQLFIAALITCSPGISGAATYYLSTSGSDSNSCSASTAQGSAKKSFSSAWGCLSAGDSLIVADGTYTSASPPARKAGSASAYIVISAANDGGAVISDGLVLRNNSYLEFAGFKITSNGHPIDAVSDGPGLTTHHVTFRRVGLGTTSTDEAGGVSVSDGSHHMLFEDFWIWGGGRYALSCYGGPGGNPDNTGCDSHVFRRGIIRQGPGNSSPGNPEAAMTFYHASDNLIENVIAIDGNQDSDSSNAAFYLTAHAPPPNVERNKYFGVIALNNNGSSFYIDANNGSSSSNIEVHNSVFWDSSVSGISVYNSTASNCQNNVFDHVTVGVTNTWEAFVNFCAGTTLTSSILTRAKTFGIKDNVSMKAADYNDVFSNAGGNYENMTAGAHDISSDPKLKYILRTESDSPCVGKGAGGTNCGADVEFRYENGNLTSTPLWPWPYEARIFKDMCTDAKVTTGFCASGSLTDYVWGYLGNPYPGVRTGKVPSAPSNLAAQ